MGRAIDTDYSKLTIALQQVEHTEASSDIRARTERHCGCARVRMSDLTPGAWLRAIGGPHKINERTQLAGHVRAMRVVEMKGVVHFGVLPEYLP